ncbi:hypothetical protein Bca4012_009690 [Brassica carinata]
MAQERVSSGETENPSNTKQFLNFHRAQRIQGTREFDKMPAGGKQGFAQRFSQCVTKSIIPLASRVSVNGAKLQTFCPNRRMFDC